MGIEATSPAALIDAGHPPPLPVASGRRRAPLAIGVIAPPYFPLPPSGYGGIERVVALLVDGLVDRGHDVTLFAAAGSRTKATLVTSLAQPPALGHPGAPSAELFHVTSAYLDAHGFDVVHDHSGMGPALGAMCAGGPPVVHTLHGPWTPEARRFYDLVQDRVDLVAISRHQRAANPGLRYAGVVHNGIDLGLHPFVPRKGDYLAYVGRVSPEKRPELAIEVARRARLPLVMVVKRSEPAERAYWAANVAPLLDDTVTVLDQPPHHVKVDVLGRARAMLFPIDWPEPFGLVMTESMACGTPVIGRPLGAATEVVDHGVTGFLCDTVDEMVVAVDAARSLRPEDCRRRVEQLFSAPAMVEGYERIYEHAVRRQRGAHGGRVAHGGRGRLHAS